MSALVRVATPADTPRFLEIYAPIVEGTTISFEEETPTQEELEGRIAETLPRFPWLTLEGEGSVLGYASAGPHRARAGYRWSTEVGIYLHPDARGQGLGKALYEVLLSVVRAQGYLNALAGIGLPNAPSVALHESLGFEPIATYRDVGFKLGQWVDVGWWQLRLAPLPELPSEPRPFAEVQASLLPRAL